MPEKVTVTDAELDALCEKLDRDARASGYFLNPDKGFTRDLAHGLLVNTKRYGYACCPCRLADGDKQKDLDLICPCDYRDPDLSEYGACYCALYVSRDIAEGRKQAQPVPERRFSHPPSTAPDGRQPTEAIAGQTKQEALKLAYPVWRCKVCGYLTARNAPPEICPICKVSKDRFERFM